MSPTKLLQFSAPPLVGGAYYAVIAMMLAALTANTEPQKPAFKISGYSLPAPSGPPAKGPEAPRPNFPPVVQATAVLSPTAPLPAVRPVSADLSPQVVADGAAPVAAEAPAQPSLPIAPQAAGGPDTRAGAPADPSSGVGTPPSPEEGPLPPPWATPGGSTLVLAVLLGADGTVLKTKILVPSGDAIANLTFGMALQSVRDLQLHVDPPLQPGESRWLVVPVDFSKGTEALP